MNKIWGILIVISIICAGFTGNIEKINSTIFNQMKSATDYIISIIFLMAFWSGINNIILNTSIRNWLKKIFRPIYKIIYGKVFKEDVLDNMCLNTFGNLFGLGNVATLSGLKVIDKLEEDNINDNEFSDDIILFTVMNTASIQILPITILNIRYSLGDSNSSKIIGYIWIVSFFGFIFLILITKIYLRFRRYGKFRKNN